MTDMELDKTCENSEAKSLIASLNPKSHAVDVIFKVIHLGQSRVVKARSSGRLHYVTDAIVADSSAKFIPTNQDIGQVNDSVDMSKPFAGEKPPRRKHRTSTGRTFHGSPRRESRGYCGRKEF
ncbi:MAG: hypothetical protein ACXABZ_08410 [Candidatus Thorarchaeota archaeon]|jgi:hypothetical protein